MLIHFTDLSTDDKERKKKKKKEKPISDDWAVYTKMVSYNCQIFMVIYPLLRPDFIFFYHLELFSICLIREIFFSILGPPTPSFSPPPLPPPPPNTHTHPHTNGSHR